MKLNVLNRVSQTAILSLALFAFFVNTAHSEGLPDPGVKFNKGRVGIVITGPQIDFLSPKGVAWKLVGKNVEENNTVENIERLMKTSKKKHILLSISPNYYFPIDLDWKHSGALEHAMHNIHMFERVRQLDLINFDGSGSDWMPQYRKYINHPNQA